MALWFSGIRRALSWNPYFSERSARSTRSLKLPDLFAPLGEGASSEFEINRHCKKVTDASEAWFREQCQLNAASTSSEKEETQVQDSIDLKAGLLAAICFPAVDFGQLRLCADFLNWMLHFEYQLAFLDTAAARKLVQESLQLSEDPTSSVGEGTGRALKRSVSFSAFPLCSFDLILIFFQHSYSAPVENELLQTLLRDSPSLCTRTRPTIARSATACCSRYRVVHRIAKGRGLAKIAVPTTRVLSGIINFRDNLE